MLKKQRSFKDYLETGVLRTVNSFSKLAHSPKSIGGNGWWKDIGEIEEVVEVEEEEEEEGSETDVLEEIPEGVLLEYKRVFDSVDEDNSGFLSRKELAECFKLVQLELSDFQLDYMVILCLFHIVLYNISLI